MGIPLQPDDCERCDKVTTSLRYVSLLAREPDGCQAILWQGWICTDCEENTTAYIDECEV